MMEWLECFLKSKNYLELYALTVAILSWTHKFRNRPITIFCYNLSVVYMVNNFEMQKLYGINKIY